MLKELSSTRYRFTCCGCGQAWVVDYDVLHVDDGHGLDWDCYFRNGQRATVPTARGVVCCPRCGSGRVHVEWVATRDAAPVARPSGPPTVPMSAPG